MKQTTIVRGIVLSSHDYKEKDKLCQIFTVELGKITALLKGCKAPNAKLKFAFQPFCFAEFSVAELGNFYQIIDAKLIDSFFDLTKQLTTYYLANLAIELVDVCVQQQEQNSNLFVLLANTLKHLCYENLPPYLVALKFCECVFENLGYKLNSKVCANCGLPFSNRVFFDVEKCGFVCFSCKNSNCLAISNRAFACIKIVANTQFERLLTVKIDSAVAREALLVLCKGIEQKQFKMLKSTKFI